MSIVEWFKLRTISMVQDFTDDQAVMVMDEYDNYLLEPFREIISVTKFWLFNEEIEIKYKDKYRKVRLKW